MVPPNWQDVLTGLEVPAKPLGIWTRVIEYVSSPRKLRFEASGDWQYSAAHTCGPDGNRNEGGIGELLVGSAPVGALVGKIGGSSADKGAVAGSAVFIVGSFCVIDVSNSGSLFLAMNDRIDRLDEHAGQIKVTIREAPADAPQAAGAPSPR